MENAVIYARYSSTGQNEQSIDGQLRICKEFAESKGFNVINTYTDKAKSAWSDGDKRVNFQKMLGDAANGTFQHIIVYKFDRFARNRLDSQMYKQRLRKDFGIRVQSATEPVSDDEGGEIYEMFLEWNDEKYSQRLSKRVRDGLDTSVANGTFCGGYLVYGYKIRKEPIAGKNDRFIKYVEIDPEPADTVRYVFTEYAKGTSKDKIAQALNAQGKRHNGAPYKGQDFDRWLTNEKYTGVFSFGERLCDNMYPPIIDRETFDRCAELLKKNKYFAKSNAVREPFLMNGKCYCAHSGTAMIADGGTSHTGATYKYYVCKKARQNQCEKEREEKNHVEEWVTTETQKFFSDPAQLNKTAEDTIAHFERKTGATEIKSLEMQIVNTKKDMENTTTAYITAVSTGNKLFQQSCEKRMGELNVLVEDLQTQRNKLVAERGKAWTKQDIIDFILKFIEGNPKDKAFQKRLIDNLVNCVYLANPTKKDGSKGHSTIYFTVQGQSREIPQISKADNDRALAEHKQKPAHTAGSGSVALGGEDRI